MNNHVKNSLIGNSIVISIITIIAFALVGLCDRIPYEVVEVLSKIIIIAISIIIDLIILFFFFLYWWSEVKWDNCKRRFHNFKKKK